MWGEEEKLLAEKIQKKKLLGVAAAAWDNLASFTTVDPVSPSVESGVQGLLSADGEFTGTPQGPKNLKKERREEVGQTP